MGFSNEECEYSYMVSNPTLLDTLKHPPQSVTQLPGPPHPLPAPPGSQVDSR